MHLMIRTLYDPAVPLSIIHTHYFYFKLNNNPNLPHDSERELPLWPFYCRSLPLSRSDIQHPFLWEPYQVHQIRREIGCALRSSGGPDNEYARKTRVRSESSPASPGI
ncbi:MAG TPA: hypothetical protein VN372_04790 [Methanospirillum sp.]|nr:hypothetical protein [Methanospirillum sp.]